MYSAPIEFDRQDEGHTAHGPLTWKVIETHYLSIGNHPYVKYNKKRVLTGPFAGTQSNNKKEIMYHLKVTDNWPILNKVKHQKIWQK